MLVDLIVSIHQQFARFLVDAAYRIFQRRHRFVQILGLCIQIGFALGRSLQLFEGRKIHRAQCFDVRFQLAQRTLQYIRFVVAAFQQRHQRLFIHTLQLLGPLFKM